MGGPRLERGVRTIENRFGAVALRGAAQGDARRGARAPRRLALLLSGALGEGCLYIAETDDTALARTEVLALIERMLSAFRAQPLDGATPGIAAGSPV